MPGRMIAGARELKVIGRPGAGVDTVDIAAASERKIPAVYSTGGVDAAKPAEEYLERQ
ncbi:MAG: hypothetical protein QF541_06225 [Lentisphaeria bacterium]|nr:hypothetical protein [Lentisphaeria bacterium]